MLTLPSKHFPFLLCTLFSICIFAEQSSFPTNSFLLWGPYRSNLYFGVRPRLQKSLLVGLMWAQGEDYESVKKNLRYTCEQGDGMKGYGWRAFDPRNGGVQTVHDPGNHIDITTEFAKAEGGNNGGHWGVRIRGTPRSDAFTNLKTTVVLNFAMENMHGGSDTGLECASLFSKAKIECRGENEELGGFEIHIQDQKQPFSKMYVRSSMVPEENLWDAKSILMAQLRNDSTRSEIPLSSRILALANEPGEGNMHFVQLVFTGSFSFDVLFSSDSAPAEMTSNMLSARIKDALASFSSRFDIVYRTRAPFQPGIYTEFSQSLLSNLLGGIGYFYGNSKVDLSHAPEYNEKTTNFWKETAEAQSRNRPAFTKPAELLTSVPSRPFFPRGFLWDEGFHLLIILDYDMDLAMVIITNWLNLMDDDGWIAREQILGAEARSKVPTEFQTQYPHHGNPPTMYLVLDAFIDRVTGKFPYFGHPSKYVSSALPPQPQAARDFMLRICPLLKRHYEWFRRTQAGDMESYDRPGHSSNEGYRWRGRTPQHTLTSGLDDYPRAIPPHPGELHIDALSWIGSMAGVMESIANFIGGDRQNDASVFADHKVNIQRSIEELHWSEEDQAYCDATIENGKHILICHKGYISLFPFLLGLMGPRNNHLGAVLNLIRDENELWSPHGLRSLSQHDKFYGTDENYWRGPVWININYLALQQLLNLAQSPSPYQQQAQEIYTSLRLNIVSTVFESWQETGFAWEQYNPDTGSGRRTQYFTGWTALVVKILAMPDLSPQSTNQERVIANRIERKGKWESNGLVLFSGLFLILIIVIRRKLLAVWRWRRGWARVSGVDHEA
ncbi:mannosyl-oligosaccharide glucosidase [Tothia fuscella]|uniref:Mannosyl-oligosaccharide glucosidase n=1 Tax=Tothia fuscella TaxID=1048955 RepID=A0A9P4P064_9PEZI|nr:mannosyl-oligosaccharide glucosidase [Tothia fuscella]